MTAPCHRTDVPTYLAALEKEIAGLVAVTTGLDPKVNVPSCPDWSVADLLEHIGGVHRWVEHQVRVVTPVRIPSTEMGIVPPADQSRLTDWVSEGGERLLATLAVPNPDAEMWAWGDDKHVRFWPRRMLHETSVHRADATFALGRDAVIEPSVAIDGVDEFLDNLPCAEYFAPKVSELVGKGEVIRLSCTDDPAEWFVTLNPHGFAWSHEGSTNDVSVEGSASDMQLFVWGRRKIAEADRLKVSGDERTLARWIENSAL